MIQKYIKKLLDQDETLLKRSIVKNKNNKYILNSKYKIGKIIIKKNIAEFITQDIQKVFIDLDNLNGAYNDDIVLVQMIFNPRSRTKAKVVNIVQRNVSKILCFIENGKCYSVKEKIELNFDFKIGNYKNGDILLIENNRVHKDLGNINDTKVDEQISLFLYNQEYRNEKYSTDINDEFNTTKRIDLTHLPFCTIDPATAKDHDDAIYFDEKENILYVAIADVSAFIKEGSTLDLEARKRAFSIYFPNKVMPMIPFSLSADLCSLKPNVKRFAFVFKIKLDTKKLKVTTSEVFEAIIKSQNKYSYETINEVLKNKISGYEQLLSLYEITTKFRSKRLQNGFDFRTQELQLTLDDNENLQKVKVKISSSSHKLVEECMLLANCEAAKKLKGLGIFRTHEEPKTKSIEKLIEDISQLGLKVKLKSDIHKTIQSIQDKALNKGLENEVDELIIQSQQQARYSSNSLGHFGLGFKNYSHFTSPIRRYADLVLHRILKEGKVPNDIEDICLDISTKEREISSLVWDLEDRKYARWAKDNIGKEFKAIIIDIGETKQLQGQSIIVKLTSGAQGARVVCENYSGEKLFSKIKIKIKSSDIISKEIKAIIA